MEDIKVIKYDIEKIGKHLTKQEQNTEENNILLKEIRHTLIGSELNGNEGVVTDLKTTIKRVDTLEKIVLSLNNLGLFLKWFFGILGTAGLGFIVVKILQIK